MRHVLPAIRVPTLILHRSGDRTIRVGAGRYLARRIPRAIYVELPGDDHWWWLGDANRLMQEMESFMSGLKPAAALDRALATILIVALAQEPAAPDAAPGWLELAVRRQIKAFRGRPRSSSRNQYIATFDGPSRALHCSLALSRQARQRRLPLRMALHSGECRIREAELSGPALKVAWAVLQAAEAGEIWLSHTVKDLVVGAGYSFEPRGSLQLGGDLGAWRLFKLA